MNSPSTKSLVVFGLVTGVLITVTAAVAQDTFPAPADSITAPLSLQLDQAVSMALDQSPAVMAAELKAESARDKASSVNRKHWGELDAVASASWFDEDRLLVPMTSQLLDGGLLNAPFSRDQIHYGVAYTIPIYLGGKLSAGIEAAKLEAAKVDALREGTTWQTRFNVVSLYAGVQTLDGAMQATDDLIMTLEAVQKRLELMVTRGKRPELDLLKVKDEMAEAQAERARLQAQRIRVAGLLLALLGQSPSRPLTVAPLGEGDPDFSVQADSLQALALASSPVRQAALTREQAESRVKDARSGFLPSIVGQANYLGHHASDFDGEPTTWAVSLGVKLPLFNGASRFADMSSAKAQRLASQQGLKLARLRREADLNEALAHLKAMRTTLVAARARVASATEAARIEQIRYDNGASKIEDLLRIRTREQAAHTALARARGELKIAAEHINTVVELEVVR